MTRLWIFLIVGPLIGFFGVIFSGAGALVGVLYLLLLLVLFYVFGAIPALLACLVDHALAGKVGDFKRAAIVGLAGCGLATATAACFTGHIEWTVMSVSGAVAGLICSLMSADWSGAA